MLRSIAASSSWRFPVIAVTQASQTTSATLRVKKLELSLISFPMRWEEGHISHCSRVLRRCHPEPSSCSGEFGCRSFKKHSPCTVCFLPCHVKKLACFYELKFLFIYLFFIRLKFTEHLTSRFCIRGLETSSKSVKFDLPNYFSL